MTKTTYPSERGAALWIQLLDALKRSDDAPFSPIRKFHSKKERRELRRKAIQLRRGQLRSQMEEYSDAELADVFDLTVRRDQIIDDARADFRKTELALDRLADEEAEEVAETFKMMYEAAVEGFKRHGPASEDAQRLRLMDLIVELGQRFATNKRRGNENHREYITRQFESSPISPPQEAVLTFADEGGDPSRQRVSLRFGIGMVSWVGIFERGDTDFTSVSAMPDQKHLLVTTCGAGYVLDLYTLKLVQRIGYDVVSLEDACSRFPVQAATGEVTY